MTWPAVAGLIAGAGIARYALWPLERRLEARHRAGTADRVTALRLELDHLMKETL